MLLTGDVRLVTDDPAKPFQFVSDRFQSDGVVFGNLEGALSDVMDPYEFWNHFQWRHPGTVGAPALKGNFAAVGLANNVIVGDRAIPDTLALLDEMGIPSTGAGMDMEAARAPAIVEHQGVRYGFLQRTSIYWPYRHRAVSGQPMAVPAGKDRLRYFHGRPISLQENGLVDLPGGPGVATIRPHTAYEPSYYTSFEAGGDAIIHTWADEFELADFLDDVRDLRSKVDVLVTSHHWRVSGSDVARDFRTEIGRAAIDAGADVVMAHGTHVIDEIEIYKGKPIFYGLGAFYVRYPRPVRGANAQVAAKDLPEKYQHLRSQNDQSDTTDLVRPPCSLVADITVEDGKVAEVACRLSRRLDGGNIGYEGDERNDSPEFISPDREEKITATLFNRSAARGTQLSVDGDKIIVIPRGSV